MRSCSPGPLTCTASGDPESTSFRYWPLPPSRGSFSTLTRTPDACAAQAARQVTGCDARFWRQTLAARPAGPLAHVLPSQRARDPCQRTAFLIPGNAGPQHAAASHAQRARGLPPVQHLPRPAHPAPAGSCPAGTRVWPRERHKCSSCWMQGTCHNAASAGRPMPAPGRGPPANRPHGTHLPNPPSPFPTTTITTGTHTITTTHQQQHIHHQNPHPRPPRPVAALPSSHLPSLPIPPHTPPAPP